MTSSDPFMNQAGDASFSFFFNHTATTAIYTLSLHDALPIFTRSSARSDEVSRACSALARYSANARHRLTAEDRKSTRLNSSHSQISYAVFCLKKKKASLSFGDYRLSNASLTVLANMGISDPT